MRHLLCCLMLLAACGGPDTSADDDDDGGDTPGDTTDDSGEVALECGEPRASVCGSEAAIVRGQVRLSPDLETDVTEGTLVVVLTHEAYSGNIGGGYHIDTRQTVDLAEGAAEFQFDMCEGGEMWTEENCDYSLLVMLDTNGNNNASNYLPDPGEPATRYAGLQLSCDAESPCLDIVLDCVDGPDCVTFTSPSTCTCAEDSCNSPIVICG